MRREAENGEAGKLGKLCTWSSWRAVGREEREYLKVIPRASLVPGLQRSSSPKSSVSEVREDTELVERFRQCLWFEFGPAEPRGPGTPSP